VGYTKKESTFVNVIHFSELEEFVSEQLRQMQGKAIMFGFPNAIECQCLLLMEMLNHFQNIKHDDLMDSYSKFRKTIYHKCPSPSMLSDWLTSKDYGLGLEDTEAANKIVDFFILFKKHLWV
jgi:hypothetical protein